MALKPKRVKVLSQLRIDEVSSVSSGAGEGVKILLMKRAAEGSTTFLSFNDIMKRDEKALRGSRFYSDDFQKYIAGDEDEIDETPEPNDEENVNVLPPALERMVNALCEANPALQRQDAIHHLLFSPSGRQLAAHISNISKGQPMNRSDKLRSIAKEAGGIISVAKVIVERGDSLGINEHELTSMISEEAQKSIRSGERPEQAFARYYQAPENAILWKAVNIAKSTPLSLADGKRDPRLPRVMDMEPSLDNGEGDIDTDRNLATEQLNELAEKQRKLAPTLSFAQAFARVMKDPSNSSLAARALRRPVVGENRQ